MKNLSFDEKGHEYRLTDDLGNVEIIPSVSKIVAAVTGKDLSRIPAATLEKARMRGEAVHLDVQTHGADCPESAWIEKQIDRGNSTFEVMGWTEIAGLAYAGRADIVSDHEIFDIKTQSAEDVLGWTIQLNLYARMFNFVDRLEVLWCPSSGNFKRVPIAILSDNQMAEIVAAFFGDQTLPADWLLADAPEAPGLELVIYSRSVGELTTNAKAILAKVQRQLEGYKAENYSEANIAEAKRDKAELNAAAKKLTDRRLKLEREFAKPFADFKDIIGEAVQRIKQASSLIDEVVKEVSDREKGEKQGRIADFFAAQDCRLFTLPQIFKAEWLNKTAKMRDIEAEIIARISKVQDDLLVLDRIGEPEAKAFYLSTLSLDSALAKADEIKANRERIKAAQEAAEAARVIETERRARIAAEAVDAPLKREEPIQAIDEPVVLTLGPTIAEVKPDEILERTMKVRGTLQQLVDLSRFMNGRGIDFEKIEGGSR